MLGVQNVTSRRSATQPRRNRSDSMPTCIPGASDVGHPASTTNNKAADPVEESAAFTAAAGMPPEPHEREAVIVARPRPLSHCADRTARYEMVRQAGAARSMRGARCERDARLSRRRGLRRLSGVGAAGGYKSPWKVRGPQRKADSSLQRTGDLQGAGFARGARGSIGTRR